MEVVRDYDDIAALLSAGAQAMEEEKGEGMGVGRLLAVYGGVNGACTGRGVWEPCPDGGGCGGTDCRRKQDQPGTLSYYRQFLSTLYL